MLLPALLILLSFNTSASIYGTDDRTLFATDQVAVPVLAQLAKTRFSETSRGLLLKPLPLKDHVGNLCEEEKFAKEPSLAKCTSFLVGDNLMVTAGHCVNNQKECEEKRWVLSQQLSSGLGTFIPEENVIACDKLIAHKKNRWSKNDFALIKIKSKKKLPKPFSFSMDNPFKTSQRHKTLYVLGHPSGLPLIHSGHAFVIDDSSEFIFKINSDTFGGNSGSPVIDDHTGEVFGILTNGDLDYKINPDKGCIETYHCPDGGCKGESVVPIFNIEELVPGQKPKDPLFDPNNPKL